MRCKENIAWLRLLRQTYKGPRKLYHGIKITWGWDFKNSLESSRSQQRLIQVLGEVGRADSQHLGS